MHVAPTLCNVLFTAFHYDIRQHQIETRAIYTTFIYLLALHLCLVLSNAAVWRVCKQPHLSFKYSLTLVRYQIFYITSVPKL